jgi:peptidoglycan/xylan/chitin deacetylase (PgdA/CDA1 family)
MSAWPDGAPAALSLTFDNLGEAAEIGTGARDPSLPLGGHPTATAALPEILAALAARELRATFFVEGLNAEVYPELLRQIDAEGHEVAYHAWTHEQWADLSAPAQAENLARGVAAFAGIGLRPAGMRPPGGGLGDVGARVLREAGLGYCSPAGAGAGALDGLAMLGFQWRHVDAACVLPGLGAVRAEIGGSDDPLGPDAFLEHLEAELLRLPSDGGYATFVLHPFLGEWLGTERRDALLDAVAAAAEAGCLWVAPCREVAAHVLDGDVADSGFTPDPTGWSG